MHWTVRTIFNKLLTMEPKMPATWYTLSHCIHVMQYAKADRVFMVRNTEWTQPANGLQDRTD